ncbi:MAG: glycosyltransferase, partial [Bacteroidetes bacterium]|nr:glycosyltransferase [Bacteroidota bacterium]
MPEVSVLIAVYNGEKFLTEAIESILQQTFTDFELIIINDGSTDKTKDIILSYNDDRIKYFENETNIKLIPTLNKGIDLACGKYIARIDADDIAMPNRLEVQYNYMEKHPEIGLCASWLKTIGDGEQKIVEFKSQHDEIRLELFFHSYMHHPTVMMRTSLFKENNIKYPNALHAEDYALWVLLSEYTKFHVIPEVLLKYRVHDQNICVLNSDFQDKQSSLIRKSQYEKLRLNCNNKPYDLFEIWLITGKIENVKQSVDVIKFLCDLFSAILKTKQIKKELLNLFFYKKVWAIICEFPSINSYYKIYKLFKHSDGYLKSIPIKDRSIVFINKVHEESDYHKALELGEKLLTIKKISGILLGHLKPP